MDSSVNLAYVGNGTHFVSTCLALDAMSSDVLVGSMLHAHKEATVQKDNAERAP